MRRRNLARLLQLPHLIRFRLTVWYTGLAALVLAAFVGSVFYSFSLYRFDTYDGQMRSALQDTFDREVRFHVDPNCLNMYRRLAPGRSLSQACTLLQVQNPNALQQGNWQMKFTLNGQPLPGSSSTLGVLNKGVANQDLQKANKGAAGAPIADVCGRYRCVTLAWNAGNQRVIGQIAGPMYYVERQVDGLKHILVYVAAVLLALSAAGGWFLAGRALRPIDEITRRAQQITAHDLSLRLGLEQEDELGRMAATFDDMIARLEEAFARQKRFTSDASHELRTPLTVMQADLGLALARPRSAEEYRQTLVSVDEEVGRLSTIVGDLLTITRIDVDRAGMQHQPVALDELLRVLCNRVGMVAAERDILVCADRLDPVTISGDATRLRQLFTNLLDNAVTYTPNGGSVTVTLEQTRDSAHVLVADTGIGITPEHLPRIFERFYRADEGRQQNAAGTGLGLAISRSVAQAHQGEITVQSTPGGGTTFTVTLPLDGRKRLRRVHSLRTLLPVMSRE